MKDFLNKLFSGDKKILRKLERQADKVLSLESEIEKLSDDDFPTETLKLKERLENGETLDDILEYAYALVREAAFRVRKEKAYKVQIMGAIALHNGDIAEMKTGEGKTLTALFPTYLNALEGKGVHVITVNEYLVERDADMAAEVHNFLGLSVGCNIRSLSKEAKRAAHAMDITYTTNSELGFDYLRDNMVTSLEGRVLRGLHFALIDEVDSVLIDESRTPLIISSTGNTDPMIYRKADFIVKNLKSGRDYDIDIRANQVFLLEQGTKTIETMLNMENLYAVGNEDLIHRIQNALRANYIMKKDVDYVVQDDKIVIVDSFTGRMMEGREFSDGLHQALQAKENVEIKSETITAATITYQNFFRLFDKLSGMSGTAKTDEEEFLEIYNMRVIEIPTNRPIARIDHNDKIYGTKKAKYEGLIEEIKNLHEKGQPILVGTIAVETSELISDMLEKEGIPHEVLNAKNHHREAEIIAKAGQLGSVTLATNMAGRGTDIKISDEVKALGGLAVLGSERHESRRIDNQLRGRSGRQGDPGMSRFFVSFEDDLMKRYGSERFEEIFAELGDVAIESKALSKQIESAQLRVEGQNFDVRKTVLDYDDVMRQQREIMYEQRDTILKSNEGVRDLLKILFENAAKIYLGVLVSAYDVDSDIYKEELAKAEEHMKSIHFIDEDLDLTVAKGQDLLNLVFENAWSRYLNKVEGFGSLLHEVEKNIMISSMDNYWTSHIDIMDKLREGIHLRSYAQEKPLMAYVEEGMNLFEEMLNLINLEIVEFFARAKFDHEESSDNDELDSDDDNINSEYKEG